MNTFLYEANTGAAIEKGCVEADSERAARERITKMYDWLPLNQIKVKEKIEAAKAVREGLVTGGQLFLGFGLNLLFSVVPLLIVFVVGSWLLKGCASANAEGVDAISVQNFSEALRLRSEAFSILDDPSLQQCDAGGLCTMGGEHMKKVLQLLQASLRKAKEVSSATLNRLVPSMGDNFEKKFLAGLEKMVGRERGSVEAWVEGQRLLNEWAVWYNANIPRLKQGR